MKLPLGFLACGLLAAFTASAFADEAWPSATSEKLPRWRGFNLDNWFKADKVRPFEEADFQIIHDLGFDFARIPMDYRIWTAAEDWTKINPDALADLDRAIAWGEKYHVHICLNFHRSPGYTVAKPPEARSLWTDEEAQRVCALHWAFFARRYKGIPSERLSFDLLNEPGRVDAATYAKVVGQLAAAIRREDPVRLIIADGIDFGTSPCPDLASLRIAQSTRGYKPMWLTHFEAPWAWKNLTAPLPVPSWPMVRASAYLHAKGQAGYHGPLVLTGTFPAGTVVRFTVGIVSQKAHLVVQGGSASLYDHQFVSGPTPTEGEEVILNEKYHLYQNRFAREVTVTLPEATSRISLENIAGDWLTLASLSVQPTPDGSAYPLPLSPVWAEEEPTVSTAAFDPAKVTGCWSGEGAIGPDWLRNQFAPWQKLAAGGTGVMVGEWGCFNKTPYEVTLRWMEDCLAVFREQGWGWALWNLSGPFGILDSDRPGAVYEDYRGHKLDRRMTDLLQRY